MKERRAASLKGEESLLRDSPVRDGGTSGDSEVRLFGNRLAGVGSESASAAGAEWRDSTSGSSGLQKNDFDTLEFRWSARVE